VSIAAFGETLASEHVALSGRKCSHPWRIRKPSRRIDGLPVQSATRLAGYVKVLGVTSPCGLAL
jgi:hypothetical protein